MSGPVLESLNDLEARETLTINVDMITIYHLDWQNEINDIKVKSLFKQITEPRSTVVPITTYIRSIHFKV